MNYIARWGPKGFVVSPGLVVPFNDFSTSVALKANSENDTSGTPPTNTRGRELQPVTLSTIYLAATGVEPRGQFEAWDAELGKAYPLYIGGKKFGPAKKFLLTKVAVSEVLTNNSGLWIKAKVSLTFEEYSEGKKSALVSNSGSSGGSSGNNSSARKAASTYEATVAAKREALAATASKSDKATKKATLDERRMAQ